MSSVYKNYIGIDISKDWLDVAILRPKVGLECTSLKVNNEPSALKKLKRDLRALSVRLNRETLVIFEHTGIYKTHLVNFLLTQHCPICIESAFRIKRSLGIQRGKNDKIDAVRIANYGFIHEKKISIWSNPKKAILIIKDLLINRDRLLKAKKLLQLPVNDFKKYYQQKDFKLFEKLNRPIIEAIKIGVKYIDDEIESILENNATTKAKLALAMSVPGVGYLVGLNLLCYTNEFTLFKKGSQLASYAGVAPFQFLSGSSVKGKAKVNPFANKKLKSLIHIAAVANLRSKNELRAYYDRKLAEGKNKMSVLNAMRNKIILRVAAAVSRGTPYTTIKRTIDWDNPELYHVQSS